MEKGTDISELFASEINTQIDVEYKNKMWEFTVRDITWSEKNQIISKSAKVSAKGGASFDINTYNQLYLEKAIVKAPFEMTPQNILRLDADFGDLLIDKIVNRAETVTDDESGN